MERKVKFTNGVGRSIIGGGAHIHIFVFGVLHY